MVENSAKTSESDSFLRPWHRQTTNHSPSETPQATQVADPGYRRLQRSLEM
jgi:hypothetical protein